MLASNYYSTPAGSYGKARDERFVVGLDFAGALIEYGYSTVVSDCETSENTRGRGTPRGGLYDAVPYDAVLYG